MKPLNSIMNSHYHSNFQSFSMIIPTIFSQFFFSSQWRNQIGIRHFPAMHRRHEEKRRRFWWLMTMIGGLRCHFGERNSVFHSAHYFRWTDNEEAVRFAQMMIPVLPLLLFLLSGSSEVWVFSFGWYSGTWIIYVPLIRKVLEIKWSRWNLSKPLFFHTKMMISLAAVLLAMIFHKTTSIMKMHWTSMHLKEDKSKTVNSTAIFVDSAQFVLMHQGTASFFHVDTMLPVLNVELGMPLLSKNYKCFLFEFKLKKND